MATEPKEPISETLLKRAHSPNTAASIHRERVKQRPLLLRPTSPDPTLNARSKRQYERLQKAKQRRKSNKPQPLSAKQKRKRCLYDIPKDQQKYSIYEPLHALWLNYMREILNLTDRKRTHVDATSVGPVLVSADYHGALLEVVRSKCVSRVGLKGIVVKDTKFTFEIVVKEGGLRRVPKEGTVFRFEVTFEEREGDDGLDGNDGSGKARKPLVFEIQGNQFQSRAPDRANRKVKPHFDPDL